MPPDVAEHAAELTSQVVQAVRLQWRQGVGEATLRLQPGQLGTVTVALRVERGTVAAVLQAENPAVQQWIEGNAGQLRSALADQGLQLDRFVVRTDPDGRQADRERREPSRPRQPRANGKHDRFELAA
jgi:flagellar hook-length control protein FliK